MVWETIMRYATQAEPDPNGVNLMLRKSPGRDKDSSVEGNVMRGDKVRIQIFTLGRFGIAFDEQAPRSKGKAKRRPLALLKALVALGGYEVPSSRLCECLWPDSDGDLGGRNLTITLHRLRSLLPTQAAVLQHGGKLTLNEQLCWVDCREFEHLVDDGLRRIDRPVTDHAPELQLRSALDLYAGDFLSHEPEESWMLAARLRLKSKFERLVSALSMHLERQDRFSEAIDLCLKALELDPLNESLYRRLMSCYLKRGEFAGALRTYRRCCEALTKGLSAPISRETERLHLEAVRAADVDIAQRLTLPPGLVVRSQALQKRSAA
jgi:DNA-binding SARP family transcriptional activator